MAHYANNCEQCVPTPVELKHLLIVSAILLVLILRCIYCTYIYTYAIYWSPYRKKLDYLVRKSSYINYRTRITRYFQVLCCRRTDIIWPSQPKIQNCGPNVGLSVVERRVFSDTDIYMPPTPQPHQADVCVYVYSDRKKNETRKYS